MLQIRGLLINMGQLLVKLYDTMLVINGRFAGSDSSVLLALQLKLVPVDCHLVDLLIELDELNLQVICVLRQRLQLLNLPLQLKCLVLEEILNSLARSQLLMEH